MQDIYTILIQNGISPIWIDEKAKRRFSQWEREINEHDATTFVAFLLQAKEQIEALTKELDTVKETLQEMVGNATTALDKALRALSDDRALLSSHLQMLECWIPLHDAIPSLLSTLVTVETKNEETLFSQPFIVETTMRYIALKITNKEPVLLSEYQRYTENSLPGEAIAKKIGLLRTLAVELEELLSRGINNSSNVITAVNKDLSPPTEYINLLHRLMVELHDIKQKILSEVPLCQNI